MQATGPLFITHLATCANDVMTANVQQAAACNAMHPIEVRLIRWLLHARDRFDSEELPLILQNAGLIKYRRGKVELTDRPALEKMSCECYGSVRRNVELIIQTARLVPDPAAKR